MIDTRHILVAGLAGGVIGLAGIWAAGGLNQSAGTPAAAGGTGLPAGALILMTGACPQGFAAAGTGQVLVSPEYTAVEGQYQGRPGVSNSHIADWLATDFQLCQVPDK